jgi:hypothetical protein
VLRSLHRALRLGAALGAHVADVIQFPGDWRGAVGLHVSAQPGHWTTGKVSSASLPILPPGKGSTS